ncbi:hypothetical protein D3C79_1024170 [compost metagenome]
MVRLLDNSSSLGCESGDHQSGSCPQIGCFHCCSIQSLHTADKRPVQINRNIRTHPGHLLHMLKASLEYRLFNDTETVGQRQQHHYLRLQIRRKGGIR